MKPAMPAPPAAPLAPVAAGAIAVPARAGAGAGALGMLALLTVIWGLSVPMMKLGLRDVPAPALVALRYLVAAPCFALLLLGRKLPRPRALAAMAALGVFGIDAGQFGQMLGVQRTSAATATMITAIIPVLTAVLAVLRLRQRLRAAHLLGFAVALAGIALAVGAGGAGLAAAPSAASATSAAARAARALTGDALVLGSAFCIAGYYVFSVEVAAREGVIEVAAWSSIVAALGLVPVALAMVPARAVHLTPASVFVVLYLGLMVTVLGIWIWLRALSRLPARIAAATQYGQPLVGIAASAVLFGDRLDRGFLLGTALVLGGVALSAVPSRRGG